MAVPTYKLVTPSSFSFTSEPKFLQKICAVGSVLLHWNVHHKVVECRHRIDNICKVLTVRPNVN